MNTVRSKSVLKAWFNTGDKPTESQFSDLITTLAGSTPNATGSDSAESVSISGGNAFNGSAGSITLNAGEATGSGTHGSITLTHPTGATFTIGTNGHITLASPHGVTIINTNTGDSVTY